MFERCVSLVVFRNKDEKLNWQNIQIDDLNRCNSSPTFFDAQGMLFHLPAFMIAELNGDYLCDLVFTLTYGLQKESYQDYQQEKYRLFNVAQRMAVADYLQFLLDEPDYIYHHQEITGALVTGYWSNIIEY